MGCALSSTPSGTAIDSNSPLHRRSANIDHTTLHVEHRTSSPTITDGIRQQGCSVLPETEGDSRQTTNPLVPPQRCDSEVTLPKAAAATATAYGDNGGGEVVVATPTTTAADPKQEEDVAANARKRMYASHSTATLWAPCEDTTMASVGGCSGLTTANETHPQSNQHHHHGCSSSANNNNNYYFNSRSSLTTFRTKTTDTTTTNTEVKFNNSNSFVAATERSKGALSFVSGESAAAIANNNSHPNKTDNTNGNTNAGGDDPSGHSEVVNTDDAADRGGLVAVPSMVGVDNKRGGGGGGGTSSSILLGSPFMKAAMGSANSLTLLPPPAAAASLGSPTSTSPMSPRLTAVMRRQRRQQLTGGLPTPRLQHEDAPQQQLIMHGDANPADYSASNSCFSSPPAPMASPTTEDKTNNNNNTNTNTTDSEKGTTTSTSNPSSGVGRAAFANSPPPPMLMGYTSGSNNHSFAGAFGRHRRRPAPTNSVADVSTASLDRSYSNNANDNNNNNNNVSHAHVTYLRDSSSAVMAPPSPLLPLGPRLSFMAESGAAGAEGEEEAQSSSPSPPPLPTPLREEEACRVESPLVLRSLPLPQQREAAAAAAVDSLNNTTASRKSGAASSRHHQQKVVLLTEEESDTSASQDHHTAHRNNNNQSSFVSVLAKHQAEHLASNTALQERLEASISMAASLRVVGHHNIVHMVPSAQMISDKEDDEVANGRDNIEGKDVAPQPSVSPESLTKLNGASDAHNQVFTNATAMCSSMEEELAVCSSAPAGFGSLRCVARRNVSLYSVGGLMTMPEGAMIDGRLRCLTAGHGSKKSVFGRRPRSEAVPDECLPIDGLATIDSVGEDDYVFFDGCVANSTAMRLQGDNGLTMLEGREPDRCVSAPAAAVALIADSVGSVRGPAAALSQCYPSSDLGALTRTAGGRSKSLLVRCNPRAHAPSTGLDDSFSSSSSNTSCLVVGYAEESDAESEDSVLIPEGDEII